MIKTSRTNIIFAIIVLSLYLFVPFFMYLSLKFIVIGAPFPFYLEDNFFGNPSILPSSSKFNVLNLLLDVILLIIAYFGLNFFLQQPFFNKRKRD